MIIYEMRLCHYYQPLYSPSNRSREIWCYNDCIALKFYRRFGSGAANVPVIFQSDWKSLNSAIAASKLHDILWQDVRLLSWRPVIAPKWMPIETTTESFEAFLSKFLSDWDFVVFWWKCNQGTWNFKNILKVPATFKRTEYFACLNGECQKTQLNPGVVSKTHMRS